MLDGNSNASGAWRKVFSTSYSSLGERKENKLDGCLVK